MKSQIFSNKIAARAVAPDLTHPAPIAYSIAQACAVSSLKRSKIYELIAAKRLAVTKIGRRTVILASSLRTLLGEVE